MILITGSNGQIGVDLLKAMSDLYGGNHILASDLVRPTSSLPPGVTFELLDVRDASRLAELLDRFPIDSIYHLAGILSAKGEQHPDLCWDVNVGGLMNVLHAARQRKLRIFWPSSIAVFGPATPRNNTEQSAQTDPKTIYGISKVAGEQLSQYHADRFGVDIRSIRFPGVISYSAPPGGGTTDYAVDIFPNAIQSGHYECFVTPDTRLPMMYMPDAVKSILDLMAAPADAISIRTSYNVTGFSFSAEELAAAVESVIPGFTCTYKPDFRQAIANSWPCSIDDRVARQDWNWAPDFDLTEMVVDMVSHIRETVGTT